MSGTEEIETADRLRQLGDRPDSDRWEYDATHAHGTAESGKAEMVIYPEAGATGTVETYAVGSHGIPLDVQVRTEDGDRVGTLVHLSPDTAEAVAADLWEQAQGARDAEAKR